MRDDTESSIFEFLPAPLTLSQCALLLTEWAGVCDVCIAGKDSEGHGEPGKTLADEVRSQLH